MPVSGLMDTSLFKEQGIAQGMLVTVAIRACGGCFCTCVLVYMWGGEEKSQSNSLEGSQSRLDSLEVAVSR